MENETKLRIAKSGLIALVGAVVGTVDTVASGLPIFTAGIPIWETLKFLNYQDKCESYAFHRTIGTKEGLINYAKGLAPYIIGASVPFAVRYHKELYNLIRSLVEN
jgi:hypothetical protein